MFIFLPLRMFMHHKTTTTFLHLQIFIHFFVFFCIFFARGVLLIYIRATRAGLLEAGGGAARGCSVQAWRLGGDPRRLDSFGAHRSGASRLTSTGADVCKCAEPRTCAGKCAEMCKPVRLNIRRRVATCVTNVQMCRASDVCRCAERERMCGVRPK